MRNLKGIFLSVSILLSAASQNATAGEQSFRDMMLGSRAITSLYSVDDGFTVVKTALGLEGLNKELNRLCQAASDPAQCSASFTVVSKMDISGSGGSNAFLMRHKDPQPIVYKNPVLPAYSDVTEPETGKLEGKHNSVDLVQYMSALCDKVNGTASFVVPKKYGKFTRLTQVEAVEAFNYLASSGDGREGWMLACEGEKRFIIEKNFKYTPEEDNKFFFYQNRGLEGVDYIKTVESEEKVKKMNSPVSVMVF